MSYSQSYDTSVHYSGTVGYSYPASQSGGSGRASYSGSVPVHITIYVNTDPFDSSVAHCNNTIDLLTGSVVAMNSAQCAAITQTGEEVSQSILNGFFGTIKTEISQQLQALDSGIKAGLGLIQQQAKAVTAQKTTMETDYNRISSRYMRLFADLDEECHKRIYALDKPAFNLSENVQKELISSEYNNTIALNLLEISELSASKIFLLVAGMHKRTREVLRTLYEYVTQEGRWSSLVESLLVPAESGKAEAPEGGQTDIHLPVLLIESDNVEGQGTIKEAFIPKFVEPSLRQQIGGRLMPVIDSLDANSTQEDERALLSREFNAMTEKYFESAAGEKDKRVYETMLSLWRNSALHI